MKSAWRSASRERDEVIQERDSLKAEVEMLKAERDRAMSSLREQGK